MKNANGEMLVLKLEATISSLEIVKKDHTGDTKFSVMMGVVLLILAILVTIVHDITEGDLQDV